MAFASLHHVGLYWRALGHPSAPAIMFANSLGTDCRLWDEVGEALSARYRVILFDQRGHGLSEVTPGPYDIDMLAHDALALADYLGLERFGFVGLSVGGLIAQRLALMAPSRLSTLVICDSAAKIGTAQSWDARIEAVAASGLAGICTAVMERWFTQAYRTTRPVELAGWARMLNATQAAGYIATCEALKSADLTGALSGITTPTLVVCGADDQSTPPALVRETAALIPGATFELIRACGHIPPAEQPEALLALLNRHFEEFLHV